MIKGDASLDDIVDCRSCKYWGLRGNGTRAGFKPCGYLGLGGSSEEFFVNGEAPWLETSSIFGCLCGIPKGVTD